ncbi:hypothetical protein [Robertmurraya siralis]|uniref:hypothetical protein n=1 Tax=Robertmurraya siralis TaxID=77777 RepID=UPI0010F50F15|nr:hypothetical protein [Robertmurraya siralis]
MEKSELGIIIKSEKVLSELETEARALYNTHKDIYSIEHKQTRELIKVISAARKDILEIGSKLLPESEFDV